MNIRHCSVKSLIEFHKIRPCILKRRGVNPEVNLSTFLWKKKFKASAPINISLI